MKGLRNNVKSSVNYFMGERGGKDAMDAMGTKLCGVYPKKRLDDQELGYCFRVN